MSNIVKGYTDYYAQAVGRVYPTEWLIRTFKGRYPELNFNGAALNGKNMLEIGFGEGRNLPLFEDLGMVLHGVEVSQKICDIANLKLLNLNMHADLRVGFNHSLPFSDEQFDCVVACHSFYYVTPGTVFMDNLAEMVRVLKPGGWFVADLVDSDCYLFKGATHVQGGLYACEKDPFGGIRDGALFQAFDGRAAIEEVFTPDFEDFSFGYQENNFYGSQQNHHLLVCRKRQQS